MEPVGRTHRSGICLETKRIFDTHGVWPIRKEYQSDAGLSPGWAPCHHRLGDPLFRSADAGPARGVDHLTCQGRAFVVSS